VQHAQRRPGRRDEVDGGGHPADVLELQVGRVGQVDVGLRGTVQQQRPARRPVRVTDQLGDARADGLDPPLTPPALRHGSSMSVAIR
jgi:hypothetical protein